MKPKSLHLEAYTISETARRLGYRSTKTLYRLLKRDLLEDYVYLENSGRVYLILEPPNLPTLAEKISANIQVRRKNIIKKNEFLITLPNHLWYKFHIHDLKNCIEDK